MASRSKPQPRIAVKVGQVYQAPRPGLPARYVKIARITKGDQPKARYFEVARGSHVRKGPRRIVGSVRWENNRPTKTYVANTTPHYLQWDCSIAAFVMGAGFELVD